MAARIYSVTSTDGTRLSVTESGLETGRSLLFIHGIAQSSLCFRRQTESGLASHYRLVSFDLRGHGSSDKPREPSAYTVGRRWAEDVAAVIEQANLDRPVIVGWSMGGRVIAQYLAEFGDGALGGINFVSSRPADDPSIQTRGPGAAHQKRMQSDDLLTCIEATSAFLAECAAKPLAPAELAFMLAYNMATPWYARAGALRWAGDFSGALSRVEVPCLVTHGRRDSIILPATAEITARHIAHAQLSWYEESGHSPFWEEPERFNRELAAFADGC